MENNFNIVLVSGLKNLNSENVPSELKELLEVNLKKRTKETALYLKGVAQAYYQMKGIHNAEIVTEIKDVNKDSIIYSDEEVYNDGAEFLGEEHLEELNSIANRLKSFDADKYTAEEVNNLQEKILNTLSNPVFEEYCKKNLSPEKIAKIKRFKEEVEREISRYRDIKKSNESAKEMVLQSKPHLADKIEESEKLVTKVVECNTEEEMTLPALDLIRLKWDMLREDLNTFKNFLDKADSQEIFTKIKILSSKSLNKENTSEETMSIEEVEFSIKSISEDFNKMLLDLDKEFDEKIDIFSKKDFEELSLEDRIKYLENLNNKIFEKKLMFETEYNRYTVEGYIIREISRKNENISKIILLCTQ